MNLQRIVARCLSTLDQEFTDELNHCHIILSRGLGEIWHSVPVRHCNLIISFRVGPSVHVRWLFGFQAKLISHHIGYLAGPINTLEAIVLLLDHRLRLLH
jgi:hypothetical protein